MVHIAICDDDRESNKTLNNAVDECCQKLKIACLKAVFWQGCDLLYEVEEGTHFDIFLLDIEMPQTNGIRLAEKIREYLPNAIIIFVTLYEKYVYEAFKVQPYRFVPKNLIDSMLAHALTDALWLASKLEGKFYIVENQKNLEKIPIKTITYIWHQGKYAYIEKIDGKNSKVRKTLKQIFNELPTEDFVWIDKGCIVGLLQIERIIGKEVVILGNIRLPVSQDRLTELKKRLRNYWMMKDE